MLNLKADILGYLIVLNVRGYGPPTSEELMLGNSHICGCLSRLEDQLKNTKPDIYQLIIEREKINGSDDNTKLYDSTINLAKVLHEFYKTLK